MAAWLRCPRDLNTRLGPTGLLCPVGIMSNLINTNMPDSQRVIFWTQTRLELPYELSVKIEFVTQIKSVKELRARGIINLVREKPADFKNLG